MYKGVLVFFLCLLLIGSVDALVEISDCLGLQDINKDPYGDYVLANDIDCSDTINWNDGAGFIPINGFSGTLDGKNYAIFGFYMKNPVAGFIYSALGAAVIKNIRFLNAIVEISDKGWGGVLMPGTESEPIPINVTIDNIYVEGNVYGGVDEYSGGLLGKVEHKVVVLNSRFVGYVEGGGGLVGQNDGLIINSSFEGTVNGTQVTIRYTTNKEMGLTGGLVGWNFGTINGSFSKGKIYGLNNTGGFVGINEYYWNEYEEFPGAIFDSYSTMDVSGGNNTGGFVGDNIAGSITNSYSTGKVGCYGNFGGFAGDSSTGSLCTNSYWNINTSGQISSACGEGKTTVEMLDKSTYVNWDFSDIWNYESLGYPDLMWETELGSYDKDKDGIADINDKCPNTLIGKEQLVYGCSCDQILKLKPGEDTLENRRGCSQGIIDTFTKAIGWAQNLFVV